MQRERLYCVLDKVSEQYSPPFVEVNDACADRKFLQWLADPQFRFSKEPEDQALYLVGEFDKFSGLVFAYEKSQHVCVNPGMIPGRRQDAAVAEAEAMRKFGAWLATRGLEQDSSGKVRQLDRGA